MNDSPQQWDDILADILVECGHCHGPVSPLPPEAPQPRYECLHPVGDACAALPAREVEHYVVHQMLGELAKPAVADLLTQALHDLVEEELPQQERQLAESEARGDIPASEVVAKRSELRQRHGLLQQFMDEDPYTPRGQVDWWKRADAASKRGLCPLLLTKVELRSGPAAPPGALHDDRITLHWRVWGA